MISPTIKLKKLVLASGNPGKSRELMQLLAPLNIEVIPQSEFYSESPEETGTTFVENAIIKARYAAEKSGLPALADDSGLAVDALDGDPGVYTARYGGEGLDDKGRYMKLLEALKDVPAPRTARFHSVLALIRSAKDPSPIICHGIWEGEINFKPVGSNGFGYCPVFFDPKLGQTAAEIYDETKNRVSHRGKAFAELLEILKA